LKSFVGQVSIPADCCGGYGKPPYKLLKHNTMKYEEENHAKDLHEALTRTLASLVPDAVTSVAGRGVHWDCDVKKGNRSCSVACFDIGGEPEYLTCFKQDAQTQAWGRTSQKDETLLAVAGWLQGQYLPLLYDQFKFIDKCKRSLMKIEALAMECHPELAQCTTRDLIHRSSDTYELWFRAKDRSCRISYYGKNEFPDLIFHWDECQLFQVQTGQFKQVALLLKRWFCDYVMPSDLESEFSWIDIGQLARYYEEGRGVEGEFLLSWDPIVRFYSRIVNVPFGPQVLEMIAQMREKYGKTLRAGQSLYSLFVSRSRRHGLRIDQPRIAFHFDNDRMEVRTNLDGETRLSFPKIELTTEIDALLKQLEAREID
jgi:hypothetical protein